MFRGGIGSSLSPFMVAGNGPSYARQPALLPAQSRGRGDLGFEATLWMAADKLRGNLDAADYKRVILRLIFLKHRTRCANSFPLVCGPTYVYWHRHTSWPTRHWQEAW